MTATESRPDGPGAGWLRKTPGRLPRGARFLVLALVLAWASLALHFSTLPWEWLRVALAIAFAVFGIRALWLTRRPRTRWVFFLGLYLAVLVGWSLIRPSHDRERRQDVAVMPQATIDGDRVRISDVGNFDYRSRDDVTVRYEERDLVGVRTNGHDEDVYLHRLRIPAESAHRLFQVYLKRINELTDRPEFYHLLSNSCTISVVRYGNLAGRIGEIDFRHSLNGWVDRCFYDTRLLTATAPFAELRRRSRVNPSVTAAEPVEDFSLHIRASVPGKTP